MSESGGCYGTVPLLFVSDFSLLCFPLTGLVMGAGEKLALAGTLGIPAWGQAGKGGPKLGLGSLSWWGNDMK